MKYSVFVSSCCLFLLAACGGGGPAPDTYVLELPSASRAVDEEASPKTGRGGSVKVVLPVANSGLDSPHIAVKGDAGKQSPVAGRDWAQPLPKIVQDALVEALERSGQFSSVVPDSQGVKTQLSLMTDIRRFHYNPARQRVEVYLVARLVRPLTREISTTVHARANVAIKDTSAGNAVMLAFGEAADMAFSQITRKISRVSQ